MIAAAVAVVLALQPNPIHFGDLVTARVSPGPPPSFAPFAIRSRHGSTFELQCLDPACAPGARGRRVTVGGRSILILARTTDSEAQQPLRSFRRQTAALPTSYAIEPGLLRALLLAGASLLVAVALIAMLPLVRRLVPNRVDTRTPIERALDLVRASLQRGTTDRRRALDVLGRALTGRPLARDALGLAWSQAEPEPSSIESFAETVERGT